MCPWGQGYNINAQGELVTKKQMPDELNQNNVLLVNDPNSYNGMGLPTSKTPNHINGVTYDRNGNILATVFHRGELWSIDKNSKQVSILLNGLGHPHAIKQDSLFRNGYIITDTNDESVIFLDSNYQPKYKLFTSDFDGKRQGLEKERWLQHTEKIADNLYCTIDMPRRKVFLFDPINKIYRDLSFNPNWAIQLISAIN